MIGSPFWHLWFGIWYMTVFGSIGNFSGISLVVLRDIFSSVFFFKQVKNLCSKNAEKKTLTSRPLPFLQRERKGTGDTLKVWSEMLLVFSDAEDAFVYQSSNIVDKNCGR